MKLRSALLPAILMLASVAIAQKGIRTGPAVGERFPSFNLTDQHDQQQTFDSLKGPNGLLLMVVQSADW